MCLVDCIQQQQPQPQKHQNYLQQPTPNVRSYNISMLRFMEWSSRKFLCRAFCCSTTWKVEGLGSRRSWCFRLGWGGQTWCNNFPWKIFPATPTIWANYSDLTRPHPKRWFSKGNHLISGKSRLVKYYNLARKMIPSFSLYRTEGGTWN